MEKLKYIFDNAKVGIAICNAEDNTLEMVNPAFAHIHGYEPHELIGISPAEVFGPECMLKLETHEILLACGMNDISFETNHIKKDGSPVPVSVHITVIKDKNGVVKHRIANIQDITERKTVEKKIEFMAHHDALTSLPNRILAKDRTENLISQANHNGSKVALLFIDLDGFKSINDSLGHSVGDEVLKMVALRLMEDKNPNDIISRQGGDEFLYIVSIKTLNEIISIVNKLLKKFEKSFYVKNHAFNTSASIGIALYPDDGDSFDILLQNADTAMYEAKEHGKNTYCFYTQQMNLNLIEQLKIQNDLKNALQNNELVLHFQPQINLADNKIIGAEALIRWQHPELGIIMPMEFIPIAESRGLIIQIGQWVIEESCRQAAIWQQNGIDIVMAINISAMQFLRGNLESIIRNALQMNKLNPKQLELELTESIMMHNTEITLQCVRNLKALGIQLSLDDFGTGYSSLAYLKRFAVDKLKIDQSSVRDILKDREDATIVKTIIQMAKNLNLKTIAEGVEDANVLAVIDAYGCDAVQGYHFAKPMGVSEFEKYYRERKI
ncbi:MAG: EAL domain-containing protein [Sulfuricurvum sp.]|nr:EAL domain-containing protein [Sulfuricurvum sp.]